MAALTLHYYPGNASMAPHMLLEELGVPFELALVDRTQGAHKRPEYLRLNPNGQIPVLVDGRYASADGAPLVLYESAAICLHLADSFPHAGLAGAPGSAERAHLYKWLTWSTNTLQATLMLYFYPERWVDEGDAHAAARLKSHAESKAGAMLLQLDTQLASHDGDWLLGGRFSAVDPYALMLGRWSRGFERPARSLPHLGPYLQRMLARPSVQRVLATEQLAAPWV